jgi:predicted HTH domain antitoxin
LQGKNFKKEIMELAQFTMSLPENLWLSMNMKTDELMSEMRKEYGIKQYQTGKLTLSQSADLCGVSIYEFVSLLTLSSIPIVDYSADELESEFNYFSKKMA